MADVKWEQMPESVRRDIVKAAELAATACSNMPKDMDPHSGARGRVDGVSPPVEVLIGDCASLASTPPKKKPDPPKPEIRKLPF